MRTSSCRFTTLWSLLASATLSAQSVLTVDASGGTPYPTIQAAVDAAVDQDVVVVRPGVYADFAIVGKGISVLGDSGGGIVEVVGTSGAITTTIQNVPEGERALLRGLTFSSPFPDIVGATIAIADNDGVVVLEDLDVDALSTVPSFFSVSQNEAIIVTDSNRVVLVGSSVRGSGGSPFAGQEFGARAMTVERGSVFVHGCTLIPGPTQVGGGTGREAISVSNGLLVLRDSDVTGGGGGFGCSGLCPSGQFPPGDGGAALIARAGAAVYSIGTVLEGGAGGTDLLFGTPVGNPGPPFATEADGAVTEQLAVATTLTTTSLVRDDDPTPVSIGLTSVPNSTAALFLDFETTPAFVPGLPGFLSFGLGSIVLLGATDTLGDYALDIDVPSFPAALQKLDVNVQGVIVTAGGDLEFSNPSIFTIVNG